MISSRKNERVKTIRGLRDCKAEFAFLEGPHLIAELATSGLEVLEVFATASFADSDAGRGLLAQLDRQPLRVTGSVLASLTDSVTPQGVLAVVRLPRLGVDALPLARDGVYLYLDGIQDPGNLGALARSAEASAVAGLALSTGCAHPNHPKALRASAGSLLRVPVACGVEIDSMLSRLSSLDPTLAALEPAGGEDLYRHRLEGTLILALGAEGRGLGSAALERASVRLTIPLEPPVESLNVTVAASVILLELARRRRQTKSGEMELK